MSQPPTIYVRQYNFAGWSVNNPTTPHQGNKLDQEYNALLASVNGTISRLSEIQQDDGALRLSPANAEALAAASEGVLTAAAEAAVDAAAAGSHTHTIAQVTGLQSSLDAKAATTALTAGLATKAASSHTHAIADVTNLQTSLDGKAATAHTHIIADVTGLQTAIDGKAASSHTHAQSEVTGLVADLAGKASSTAAGIAKAWVSFDGTTGTPTIKSSHNVTGVTRNSTGVFTISFTAGVFSNGNYCWVGSARNPTADHFMTVGQNYLNTTQTATQLKIVTMEGEGLYLSSDLVNVTVYG